MVNPWVIHVKDFAQRNGLSYGCALSTPACKAEYQRNKHPKPPDYTKELYKIGALLRDKRKAEAIQAFNALHPKIKALDDGADKERHMVLLSSLRRAIGKLQSPTS